MTVMTDESAGGQAFEPRSGSGDGVGSRLAGLDFASMLAVSIHDMKNSVAAIVGAISDVLEVCEVRDDRREAAMLFQEAHRLNANLVQLLTLYRAQQGLDHFQPSSFDLVEWLEDHVAGLIPAATYSAVEFVLDDPVSRRLSRREVATDDRASTQQRATQLRLEAALTAVRSIAVERSNRGVHSSPIEDGDRGASPWTEPLLVRWDARWLGVVIDNVLTNTLRYARRRIRVSVERIAVDQTAGANDCDFGQDGDARASSGGAEAVLGADRFIAFSHAEGSEPVSLPSSDLRPMDQNRLDRRASRDQAPDLVSRHKADGASTGQEEKLHKESTVSPHEIRHQVRREGPRAATRTTLNSIADERLWVLVTIEDDGPGYPLNRLGRVRAEDGAPLDRTMGQTGLGLYFAARIAAMHRDLDGHGGWIVIDNESSLPVSVHPTAERSCCDSDKIRVGTDSDSDRLGGADGEPELRATAGAHIDGACEARGADFIVSDGASDLNAAGGRFRLWLPLRAENSSAA
ncbi:MAG: hypothetical protein ACK4IT_09380 [Thioalkalivibrionaceae bacterium]